MPYPEWHFNDFHSDGPEVDDWVRGAGGCFNIATEALRTYTLFLKCYDKFSVSHDHKVAMDTCKHLKNGCPIMWADLIEEWRADQKWAGVRSNYVPVDED